MNNRTGSNSYYEWLRALVLHGADQFHDLTRALHSKVFYAIVPNDENRVADGIILRELYCEETKTSKESLALFTNTCSFFEMLVALILRIRYQLAGTGYEFNDWFVTLISNIDLADCTDDKAIPLDYVYTKIDYVVDRHYNRSGEGGLFPLKNSSFDQRRRELWYQMQDYLMENFDFF